MLVGAALFLATAVFTLWQNSRVAVLWDLSFLLDSAWRFSLGAIPYRTLPFSHAPLTFLIQAVILRLFGRVYWHIVVYAALAGGVATLLTWRLLIRVFHPLGPNARPLAALLATPLVFLGIYGIYPHPIYDSDAIVVILAALTLLHHAVERKGKGPVARVPSRPMVWWSIAAGAALVLPLFFKLNIGLAFLCSTFVALAALALTRRHRPSHTAPELITLAAAVAALAAGLLALNTWVGLMNYFQWTVRFAAQRRLPGISVVLRTYHQPSLLWTIPCAAGAFWLLSAQSSTVRRRQVAATLLLAAPFLWTLIALLLTDDPGDRADQLLSLWPHILLLSAAIAAFRLRETPSIQSLLPWILLATIHGTFLSQQLWGSTYAIWPLLMLLIASLIVRVPEIAWPLGLIISATLLVCGTLYARSHERLSYIHLEGQQARATMPSLRGMSSPGPWIPGFEELLRFAGAEIPQEDGILLIPGEDPFFLATGRTPRFPVLLFDPATFPYTPEETSALARATGIRWLVIKRDLQLTAPPYDQLPAITAAVQRDFTLYRRLTLYDVYRRR